MGDRRMRGSGMAFIGGKAWRAAMLVVCALAAACVLCGCEGVSLPFDLGKNAQADADVRAAAAAGAEAFDYEQVPAYGGSASVAVNGNVPFFTQEDFARGPFEYYSRLDRLGRCGPAFALVGAETLPTQKRGSIGEVRPSGWQIAKYDWVDGLYLYNRCHLIAHQLTGEDANERNLITGTRYLNVEGMQMYEDAVGIYVKRTGNHVLYRVTPVFQGRDLIARGVLLEGRSVEDGGDDICFCRWCYNVQPGVEIDYATGASHADGTIAASSAVGSSGDDGFGSDGDDAVPESDGADENEAGASADDQAGEGVDEGGDFDASEYDYVLNTGSLKFHRPTCPSVQDMSEHNRQGFNGDREELIERGYSPCNWCRP